MPCDSLIRQSINFSQAKGHLDLLEAALKEQDYTVHRTGDVLTFQKGYYLSGAYQKGKFETSASYGYQFDVDAVKRSFSKQVVRKAARTYGWSVVEDGNKLQIRKRA